MTYSYFVILLLAACQFQSAQVAMTQRRRFGNSAAAIPDAYFHKGMDTKDLQKHRHITDEATNIIDERDLYDFERHRAICKDCRAFYSDSKEDMQLEENEDEEAPNEQRDSSVFLAKGNGKTYALSKLEATVSDSTKPHQNAFGKMISERFSKNRFFRRNFYSNPEKPIPRSEKRLAIYAEFSNSDNDNETNNKRRDETTVHPGRSIEFVGYPFLAEKFTKSADEIEKDLKTSKKTSNIKVIKFY